MQVKNETEIQLMKILFKTNGSKATKNITSKRAYPIGIENQYYRLLKSYFKPLTDYVNKCIDENMEKLLRGDSSKVHLDEIPGDSYRNMIYELEKWISVYMPDISELPVDSNDNVIYTGIGKTADKVMKFSEKEFQKTIEKGIHVNAPTSAYWWNDMKNSWAEDNYDLITSNAKNYVSKINILTEQAIVNGLSPSKLKAEIKKATEGLSDKHCKLLARDQMGKLNGQITQSQMQEIGLDLYVWSTAYDDRVRDSHALMEGLLCTWSDASICSYDNGKTWVDRPSGAVTLHPGQDIQCRCVALAFYPELESEMTGEPMAEIVYDVPPVQTLPEFTDVEDVDKIIKNIATNADKDLLVAYTSDLLKNTSKTFNSAFGKLSDENENFVNIGNSSERSRFNPDSNKIILNPNDKTVDYVHEVSHFIDNALGKNGQVTSNLGLVKKYRWNFSKSKEFEKTYVNELNGFVDGLKKQIKDKYKITVITIDDLDRYLKESNFSNRERSIISDMFTAKEKKNFGGHNKSYFIDAERTAVSKQFENEKLLSEGYAELSEVLYYKNFNSEFKKLINDNFSKSIFIINEGVDDYLGGKS